MSPLLPSPALGIIFFFLSPWTWLLYTINKQIHTTLALLCLAYLSLMSLMFSNVVESWNFLPLSTCRMPHCMRTCVLLVRPPGDGHLATPPVLLQWTVLPWTLMYDTQILSGFAFSSRTENNVILCYASFEKTSCCLPPCGFPGVHSNTWGLHFLPTWSHMPAISSLFLLTNSHLFGMKYHLCMVFLCVSIVICNITHHFCELSSELCSSPSFGYFLAKTLVFSCTVSNREL